MRFLHAPSTKKPKPFLRLQLTHVGNLKSSTPTPTPHLIDGYIFGGFRAGSPNLSDLWRLDLGATIRIALGARKLEGIEHGLWTCLHSGCSDPLSPFSLLFLSPCPLPFFHSLLLNAAMRRSLRVSSFISPPHCDALCAGLCYCELNQTFQAPNRWCNLINFSITFIRCLIHHRLRLKPEEGGP